jgi:hypothetical protein
MIPFAAKPNGDDGSGMKTPTMKAFLCQIADLQNRLKNFDTDQAMQAFHEKVFFGIISMIGAALSTTGAILTDGETRWVFVTFTVSILTAAFLALTFKAPSEGIRLVVGRCGLSVLGGILGTQPVVHYFKIDSVHENVISLAAASSVVCVAFFFVGYAMLKIIEAKAPVIAEKWFKKLT